ncbi:hypothetical protein [Arcicella rigui]|uniref:Outer membrane protein n=1 Tax=Arcicella rigui TaxID=797020 RepID=A0ABU5Q9S1_9BACT|nr:hypothetical protein [Arcicella rigui]MEA5139493.1 hypothetical protein [Arcicella rigui]
MKRILLCLLLGMLGKNQLSAQQTPAATPPAEQKVTVYGFLRNDVYYNSRRNLDLRDGVLDVYPLDATNLPTRTGTSLTPNANDDANAIPQLGYSAIVTRLGVKIGGITAFGAKASGTLETDFFGITNGASGTSGGGTENLLRLRHAYVALDWTKDQLMIGQYWNPNFIPKCFPGTANFSTGIPFNPFSFVPQVRLTHKMGKEFSLMGMMYGYNLAGFSPAGTFGAGTGVDAQKFSTTPAFATQLGFENKKFLATVGLEGNTLTPRITDTYNSSTGVWGGTGAGNVQKNISTSLFTLNLLAFAKLTTDKATVKFHTTYGKSYTQYVGMGGFAEYRDATTGQWKYEAQSQLNMWGEIISTTSKKVQPAIFIGYLQNLGLSNPILASSVKSGTLAFQGRGISTATSRTFDNLLRISPRVDIYSGKMKFAFEYELSLMKWADIDATVPNADGSLPTNISFKAGTGSLARPFDATNSRISAVMVYNF